eukprot:4327399-Ditylum_brightwellii.AAC.1
MDDAHETFGMSSFENKLIQRAEVSKIMMTAGSTTICKNKHIVEDDCTLDTEVEINISSEEGSEHSEASVDNDSLSDWEETSA